MSKYFLGLEKFENLKKKITAAFTVAKLPHTSCTSIIKHTLKQEHFIIKMYQTSLTEHFILYFFKRNIQHTISRTNLNGLPALLTSKMATIQLPNFCGLATVDANKFLRSLNPVNVHLRRIPTFSKILTV